MAAIQIGNFDSLIELQKPVITKNEYGAYTIEFDNTTSVKVYADVDDSNSLEEEDGDNIISKSALEITTYSVAGLDNTWRLIYNSTVYNIQSVNIAKRYSPFIIIKAKEEEV